MRLITSGVFLTVILSSILAAPAPAAEEDSLRLPTTSFPINYDISLVTSVHTGARAFTGNVKIEIEIEEATNVITLHNRQLEIQSATLKDEDENDIPITFSNDRTKEFFIITSTGRTLEATGRFTVEINYRGQLQSGTSGFYRSSYRSGSGTRYLAATQFESTNARYAFPCYDEPGFKARFNLKITHDTSYTAISNTPGDRLVSGDTTTTTFGTTPVMSTYLLAFVVSDFDYISNEEDLEIGETIQRIYARPDDVEQASYALDKSIRFLKELERYCDVLYELPKMYSVAVPDFGAGAMENWGIITYKEQYLLGSASSHPRDVLEILKTIAHELGHQFFGNLVTCQWWDQIWLNEGFATLFEYLLVDNVYPIVRMKDYFNIQKLQNAFKSDSLQSTRAMYANAETPAGISGLFDRIAYDKSGSVIRMFQYAVGEEIFRDALNLYLTTNNHKPVTSDDLYEAFEIILSRNEPRGFAFTTAFKSWENQKGYPVIHVSLDEESKAFTITQERYLQASEERVADDTSSWYIPLNFASSSDQDFENTEFTHFIESGTNTKTISTPENFDFEKWFIFNKQQIGYYRVNYDFNNWHELIKVLNSDNFKQIHVLNRAQLIDDSLNFAADGYLGYQVALGVLQYLSRETDYIPWKAAANNLERLDYILAGRPPHEDFKKFVKLLSKRLMVTLGYEQKPTDTLMDRFARELVIDWMCRLGDEKCLTQMSEKATKLISGEIEVPASLEIVTICHGLSGLNHEEQFNKVFQRMQASNDQAERLRLIDGLLCSSDPKVVMSLLESLLGSEFSFRTHERQRIFNNIAVKSPVGLQVMTQYLSMYYNEIVSVFSASAVDSVIIAMSRRISLYDDQALLTRLIDELEGKLDSATRATVMKIIDDNKEWHAGNKYFDTAVFISDYVVKSEEFENTLRLPTTSAPQHYRLHIDARNIHTGARDFKGEVEIDVVITEATDKIMIHSKSQVIDELKVHDKSGTNEIPILDFHLYVPRDTLTIYLLDTLPVGEEIIIHIKYSTELNTFGSGFHQSSYVINGQRRYLGATQFQPYGGRLAFPHYDEPGYKATFTLKITHDSSVGAIANTMGSDDTNSDGTVTTSFGPTPVMSSYLLAFVVSDFDYVTNADTKNPDDTLHRVWVRPDSVSKAWYALENSAKVLKALENYVGFEFALPKVDSAAIPNKGGAMENWGMVTYWETAMIYEEDYEDISHSLKRSGVDVIGHELAHQFFGDAVTCEWWSYTWLNEGYATMFSYLLTDILYPAWNSRHFFNLNKLQNAFRYDSGSTTRSMTFDVATLSEISASFDTIGYDKSGAVLRMFQFVVGEEIFTASLKLYLETNNYKPVNSQHLVDAFKTVMAEKGVTTFDFDAAFRSWETQAGYPVIDVTFTDGQFRITQQRFFTNKPAVADDTSSWYIPLNFATKSTPNFDDTQITNFFVNGQPTATISAPANFDASQWFVFNKQQLGYYRVNYDFNNWHALIVALNSDDYDKIHVLNRAQLIDDSWTFAAGGYLDYNVAIGILGYLNRETEYTPWAAADRYINQLYTTFGPTHEKLNTFIRHLSEKFYDAFKVPDNYIIPFEEVYERYGRVLAFKIACNAGNEQCLTDTYIQNHLFADHDRKIPKGMESVIFCSGFRGPGKEGEWVEMWKKMQNTPDANFKSLALNGLGCTDNKNAQKDYLYSTLGSGNSVNYTAAERRAVVSAVLNSYTGLEAVINFFKEFELDILRNFGYGTLEAMITVPARTIKTREQQAIFTDYMLTVSGLDGEAFKRVSAIISANIQAQQTPTNSYIMEGISKIVAGVEQETTTANPTTTPSETSTASTSAATEPTTITVTPPPTTTAPTTITGTPPTTTTGTAPTTTTEATTTTDVPTTITTPSPSDPTPASDSTPPVTEPSTTSTTQGASTTGIKLVTLVISLFIVTVLKN